MVRQELVARQLAAELGPPPVRIIDLGCGQGTQAVALARRGYELTGVDASAELLARFEWDLAAEPGEVGDGLGVGVRLGVTEGDGLGVPEPPLVLTEKELVARPAPPCHSSNPASTSMRYHEFWT